jgi:AraC-like DNA-binding protein
MLFVFNRFCQCSNRFNSALAGCEALEPQTGVLVAAVREGQCTLAAREGEPAGAGTGSLIVCGVSLLVEPLESCRLEGVLLEGLAAVALRDGLDGFRVMPPRQSAEAHLLLRQLLAAGTRQAPEDESALAYALCCKLAVTYPSESPCALIVQAALAEMHDHYAELYGIGELAEALMISKGHLSRCFTMEIGISPGKYLTGVRMGHVKRLLAEGEHTLETIAALCGFSGANYLCKVFRREAGVTPAQWRDSVSAQGQCSDPLGGGAEEWLHL